MYKSFAVICFIAMATGSCGQNANPMPQTPQNQPQPEIVKTEEEWKKILTPEQYYVLRQAGTERPFTGEYTDHKEKGNYLCAGCGTVLFAHDEKFDSHCGWPSFYDVKDGRVTRYEDFSHGMHRIEVRCAKCDGHLGHVFPDGPKPTGLRYCINSVSLTFQPVE